MKTDKILERVFVTLIIISFLAVMFFGYNLLYKHNFSNEIDVMIESNNKMMADYSKGDFTDKGYQKEFDKAKIRADEKYIAGIYDYLYLFISFISMFISMTFASNYAIRNYSLDEVSEI